MGRDFALSTHHLNDRRRVFGLQTGSPALVANSQGMPLGGSLHSDVRVPLFRIRLNESAQQFFGVI